MSTKKRIFIISMLYLGFFILLALFLLIGASTFLTDIKLALSIVYSLFLVVVFFGMGMTTRFLSCRWIAWLISFVEAVMFLSLSICLFNVYPSADIYSLNAGDSLYLTPFKDIGITYYLYSAVVFSLGYFVVHFTIKIVDWIKVRKMCKSLSERKQQITINDVRILKNYNKLTNRYERYLIWRNKKGELCSSEKILYYDNVELVAVDSRKNIYAMVELPRKITVKEYLEILHQ